MSTKYNVGTVHASTDLSTDSSTASSAAASANSVSFAFPADSAINLKHHKAKKKNKSYRVSNREMRHFGKRHVIQRVQVTKKQQERARRRARMLGRLRNSITNGRSNYWGMLGEEVVTDFIKGDLADTRDYDVVAPNGARLEVKTKKTNTKAMPKPFFECSVCDHNTNQQCDAYVFVRVSTLAPVAFVCGALSRSDFYRLARRFRKGDRDSSNRYVVTENCHNVNMSQLKPLHHFTQKSPL